VQYWQGKREKLAIAEINIYHQKYPFVHPCFDLPVRLILFCTNYFLSSLLVYLAYCLIFWLLVSLPFWLISTSLVSPAWPIYLVSLLYLQVSG
jgi:hypothetical protein